MLTLTDSQSTNDPKPAVTRTKVPQAAVNPLRLTLGGSEDAVMQVNRALAQTQRRLDNLRDLIDRFDLDDDDGPRAA